MTAFKAPIGAPVDPVRADFRNFLILAWSHLGLPAPTPIQFDLARWLQFGPRRKVTMAFRGVGKSWIYAAFVCWRLLCDPDWKIMVVSASKALADSLSIFVRRLIAEMPLLAHLKPRGEQRDSAVMFDVGPARASKEPSVKSVGITGQITGSRADEILADDVESLNNSATQGQRDKLAELVKEFDAVLKPGGTITYLGTAQTAQSLYHRLESRGYALRIWPARIPAADKIARYGDRLAPFIRRLMDAGAAAGDPVEPTRFPDADLREREASYGRSGFSLQYMLDPDAADADRFPLKLRDLIVARLDPRIGPCRIGWCDDPDKAWAELEAIGFDGDRYHRPLWTSPETAPYSGAVMFIDPSGAGRDETGYAVVKALHGMLFLTAAGGLAGGYDETVLERLAKIAVAQAVPLIQVEANFGGGMFGQLLKPVLARLGHVCAIEDVRATGQKELRIIETLEPVLNQHRLVACAGVIEADWRETEGRRAHSLAHQLTGISRERGSLAHDDRIDALAGAVRYWADSLARDMDKAAGETARRALEAELRDFKAGFKPGARRMAGWVRAGR